MSTLAEMRRKPRRVYDFKLLGVTADELMAPIVPEKYVLPGLVPTEAYTLVAGALSTYKTTLLVTMMVWRATGYDLLDLSPSAVAEPGPAVLVFYEDNDLRTLQRLKRVVQECHQRILAFEGEKAAKDFLRLVEKNLKRRPLTGRRDGALVHREDGAIARNEDTVDKILEACGEFAPNGGVLLGIDPLRLAMTGLTQNDDDGADVVVHTLNYMANELTDGGVVVTSHTTKAQAKEPGNGYEDAALATSGSALYSNHARSNFKLTRLKQREITEKFDLSELTPEEVRRRPIARLEHGRLSHGLEAGVAYVHMTTAGVLVPIAPRQERSVADTIRDAAPVVIAAIDRLHADGLHASETAICGDAAVRSSLGGEKAISPVLRLLEENAYIEFTGKTRTRDCKVVKRP